MTSQNYLPTMVLRAKYCNHYPIESVKPKPTDYWAWKGILKGRDIYVQGKDVQLWEGKNCWISSNLNFPLVDTIKLLASANEVESCVFPHINNWDQKKSIIYSIMVEPLSSSAEPS